MASIKISELNELTSADSSDILPIVDSSANETKKISYENLLKSGFTILTGAQTLDGSGETGTYKGRIFEINYPTGFTKNNTIVVAFLLENVSVQAYIGRIGAYGQPPEKAVTAALLSGNYPRQISLQENVMRVYIYTPFAEETTFNYKIVLMKIS